MKKMKNIIFLIIILVFINISNEDSIQVKVTAKSGIIEKTVNIQKTEFSFHINCEVNRNITNNITKEHIFISVKRPTDSITYNANCNLVPVRVIEEETALTSFLCIIDIDKNTNLNEETNLIIVSGPTKVNSDNTDINFIFIDFDKISEFVKIGDLTLEHLEEDYCKNNNFLFGITSENIETTPLLSTICNISLSNDENHKVARCAIPISGSKIKCFVDVSSKKYVKNNNISILAQDLAPCENGQNLEILNDATNNLVINEECGEIINNKNEWFCLNKLFSLIMLLIIF